MPESHDKQTVRADFAHAKQLLGELTELNAAAQTGHTRTEEERREARRSAIRLNAQLEAQTESLYERVSPFERVLSLREQVERKKELLTQAGVLIPLSNGELGIKTIEGVEVPFPSLREVSLRLKALNVREEGEQKPFLERKIDQGFGNLHITPFGMPIAVFDTDGKLDMSESAYGLANIYVRLLVKTFNEGRLYYDDGTPIPPDEFDKANPLYIDNEFKTTELRYRLTEFDKDPVKVNGETKPNILHKDPQSAYRIGLVERSCVIPRKEAAETIGGRHQLDTSGTSIREYMEKGKTEPYPTEYFAAFQGKDPKNTTYRGERPQMPEEALVEAIEELIATGKVSFDWQGNSSINYCLGAVFANGRVPDFSWDRVVGQAVLYWYDPGDRNDYCGVRSVAGER